jgi:hypothetical protein
VERQPPRILSKDHAAHAVRLPSLLVHFNTNSLQALVLLANALVIVPPPRISLLLDPSAPVVPDPPVGYPPLAGQVLGTDLFVDACTCEKATDGGINPNEIDFTTKA